MTIHGRPVVTQRCRLGQVHDIDDRMAMFDREIEAAKEAVRHASRVCRAVKRKLEEVRAIAKDDKSPVTVADLGSQAVVAHVLEEELGHVVLVAEEDAKTVRGMASSGASPIVDALLEAVHLVWPDATAEQIFDAIDRGGQEPPSGSNAFWTLDPIDGTKGFLRGEQYAVSLARIERGAPTLGVLGCPNLALDKKKPPNDPDPVGSLYFAVHGQGLWEARVGA